MEQTINKRYESLIKSLGFNVTTFAAKLGFSQTAMANVTNGNNKPSFAMIEATINAFPQVNLLWLMKGEGTMFLDSEGNIVLDEKGIWSSISSKYEEMFEDLRSAIKVRDAMVEDLRYTIALQKSLLGKFNPAPDNQGAKVILFEPFIRSGKMVQIG